MRRIDIQYAVSVLIGALLGVGLFLFLGPRLKPPQVVTAPATIVVPSESTDPGVASRPISPRPIVLGAKPSAQTRQERARSGQQDRRVLPVRPVNPGQRPRLPASTNREQTTVAVAQPTPRRAPPDAESHRPQALPRMSRVLGTSSRLGRSPIRSVRLRSSGNSRSPVLMQR